MSDAGLLVLWFSKDRAFQLSNALRTFHLYAETEAAQPQLEVRAVRLQHAVLYRSSSPQHALAYEQLARSWPEVRFIDELSAISATEAAAERQQQQSSPFTQRLYSILSCSTACEYVLLCVDDLLFFSVFSLPAIISLLQTSPLLLGFHLALHLLLTEHQPSGSRITLPSFTPSASLSPASAAVFPSLVFPHLSSSGSHDFRCPFSLTGSLYRGCDVLQLLRGLLSSSAASFPCHHPNLLESSGNALITTFSSLPAAVRAFLPQPPLSDPAALALNRPLAACTASQPICAAVTVNRVQAVYSNPICGDETEQQQRTADELLALFQQGTHTIDETQYASMGRAGELHAVHVGHWSLTEAFHR